MVGKAFEIHAQRLSVDQLRFAAAGKTAHQHHRQVRQRLCCLNRRLA